MSKKHLVLEAGKSVFGGDCLGSLDGKPCFIEGALPGEIVEAEILKENKNFFRARVLRVVKSSPHRTEPVCPHVDRCGGCQYQHVRYSEELRLKHSQLEEMVRTGLGWQGTIAPVEAGPKDYHYRRSATFHRLLRGPKLPPAFAYIGKDNVHPVFIKQCDLLDSSLEEILRSAVPTKAKKEKITYKVSDKGIVTDEKENFFRVRLSGRSILAHSQGFFQNNWEVTEKMAETLAGWVQAARPSAFWDLYAGVGTFSLLSAPDTIPWTLVEESPYSLQALRMNLEERGLSGKNVVEGRVERVFPAAWDHSGDAGAFLLMDPPRQGLDKVLAEYLSDRVGAHDLVYISCDPSTLCRDLKILLSKGRWVLEEIAPFDMFPRTAHVEAVARLRNVKSS